MIYEWFNLMVNAIQCCKEGSLIVNAAGMFKETFCKVTSKGPPNIASTYSN